MNDAKRRFPDSRPVPVRTTRAALVPGAAIGIGEWRVSMAAAPLAQASANTPWPTGLYARRLARAR